MASVGVRNHLALSVILATLYGLTNTCLLEVGLIITATCPAKSPPIHTPLPPCMCNAMPNRKQQELGLHGDLHVLHRSNNPIRDKVQSRGFGLSMMGVVPDANLHTTRPH